MTLNLIARLQGKLYAATDSRLSVVDSSLQLTVGKGVIEKAYIHGSDLLLVAGYLQPKVKEILKYWQQTGNYSTLLALGYYQQPHIIGVMHKRLSAHPTQAVKMTDGRAIKKLNLFSDGPFNVFVLDDGLSIVTNNLATPVYTPHGTSFAMAGLPNDNFVMAQGNPTSKYQLLIDFDNPSPENLAYVLEELAFRDESVGPPFKVYQLIDGNWNCVLEKKW